VKFQAHRSTSSQLASQTRHETSIDCTVTTSGILTNHPRVTITMVTFTRRQPAINFKYFDFLNRETLVDVTIIADGHIMQAHKVVLAAASSYFEVRVCLRFIPQKFLGTHSF
jgi:hypothetical protein